MLGHVTAVLNLLAATRGHGAVVAASVVAIVSVHLLGLLLLLLLESSGLLVVLLLSLVKLVQLLAVQH